MRTERAGLRRGVSVRRDRIGRRSPLRLGLVAAALVLSGCGMGGEPAERPTALPTLPEPEDLHSLVIRTDFSDDAAWQQLLLHATRAGPEGFAAAFTPVDDPAFANLIPAACPDVPAPEGTAEVFLADAQSMVDGSLVVVALGEFVDQPGQSFRVTLEELGGVQINLAIANMSFWEFARATDAAGVFRGFG